MDRLHRRSDAQSRTALRTAPAPSAGSELTVARASERTFQRGEIQPTWVISGNPQTETAKLITARDECAWSSMWRCSAGRFEWHYVWDETVMILEGEVRITDSKGTVTLRAGDVAHFHAGSVYLWEIDDFVRKVAFLHRPVRSRLKSLLSRGYRIPALMSVLTLGVMRLVRR